MGIDYQGAIMIGVQQSELEEELVVQLVHKEAVFEICAPYYDGDDCDHAIVGYTYACSGTYEATPFKWDEAEVTRLKAKFKKQTGLDAKVWISPLGY